MFFFLVFLINLFCFCCLNLNISSSNVIFSIGKVGMNVIIVWFWGCKVDGFGFVVVYNFFGSNSFVFYLGDSILGDCIVFYFL